MHFTIRQMKKKDIKQVQQVVQTSWNSTYGGIIPIHIQEGFLRSNYSDEMLKKRMERSLIIVAEADGKIVGFANFYPGKAVGEVELAAIYLFPEYQGKGIGTSLLQAGIKRIGSVKKMFSHVEKENQMGMNFYKAKGFEYVSEFDEDFNGHTLQTVRMVLKLDGV